MTRFNFTTYIERGDDELEVAVEYSASPYVAATYWQPAEGCEVELHSAEFVGVDAATLPAPLTEAEEAKITAECEARVCEDFAERVADEADHRYDMARDNAMMGGAR